MTTYPNQRTVIISKSKCTKDFLQVNNVEWQGACQYIENYGTFKMYLYLAGNKDNFTLALSPVAVEEAIGISESTYRRAFKELKELGYLRKIDGKKNAYQFNAGL